MVIKFVSFNFCYIIFETCCCTFRFN